MMIRMFSVLAVAAVFYGCNEPSNQYIETEIPEEHKAAVLTLTKENFAEYVKADGGIVMVDFWASWCGPCRKVAPTVAKIAAEKKGEITVGKVDTDKNAELSGRYSIEFLPTVVIYKDGREIERLVGVQPESAYLEALEKAGKS